MNDRQKAAKEEKRRLDVEETRRMHQWFQEIWDEREDERGYVRCFETDVLMHRSKYRNNTCCYDHVLEKGSHIGKQYKFTKENIVIVLPSVHASKGFNTPRMDKYREELLNLHYENKLK